MRRLLNIQCFPPSCCVCCVMLCRAVVLSYIHPHTHAQNSQQPPPIVVMGHGMGAQKDIGLWMYGERFCEAGMAVLVFDYRGFGGSEGLLLGVVVLEWICVVWVLAVRSV